MPRFIMKQTSRCLRFFNETKHPDACGILVFFIAIFARASSAQLAIKNSSTACRAVLCSWYAVLFLCACIYAQKKPTQSASALGGRWDSNPRPLVPQTSALTN